MTIKLNIRPSDRQAVQLSLESLQTLPSNEAQGHLLQVLNGNSNVLRSFVKGAYDNPKTWWIGVLTLQMQYGMHGARLRALASSRADLLKQILSPLWKEVKNATRGDSDAPILSSVIRYAIKHHPALITGRLAGGMFVTYATLGGRAGRGALRRQGRLPAAAVGGAAMFTNFGLASYGAGIMTVGLGYTKLHDVLFAILTGTPKHLPPHYMQLIENSAATAEELATREWLEVALSDIERLARIGSGPVPIREFCSRPENLNLAGICK